MNEDRYDRLRGLVSRLAQAQRRSIKAAEARFDLPPGTSRARVTSANARHARAAEERDRVQAEVRAELAELPELVP